jgi:transcriptional regulator with XRE-family HTH domain
MTSANIIGAKVRKLRYDSGLTQELLAARCGVLGWRLSRGTLAKIEAGVRCVSDAELWLLAKALRCPMERLFPDKQAEILAALEIREPL